jgi:hypothetical protein
MLKSSLWLDEWKTASIRSSCSPLAQVDHDVVLSIRGQERLDVVRGWLKGGQPYMNQSSGLPVHCSTKDVV